MVENRSSVWSQRIPIRQQIEATKRISRYAFKEWKGFALSLGLSILGTVMMVILPRVVQIYMDQYLTSKKLTTRIALIFALGYFTLLLIQALTVYFSRYFYQISSEKTVESIRNRLFEWIHHLGMRYFDQTPAGSIVSRVTNDTETLKEFWKVYLDLFEGIIVMISVFIGMFILNAKMALMFLLFIPIIILVIWYYQSYSSKVYRMMRERLSQLNTKINESISGMLIIQSFRQEEREKSSFAHLNKEHNQGRIDMVRMNALLLMPVINLLEGLSLALIIYVLGKEYFKGVIEIGVVYAFTQYSTSFFRPMSMMMDGLSSLQDGIVSALRILKVLDNEETIPNQNNQSQAYITEGKIEFKDVSFSYDSQHTVLNGISFTVNPGEMIAIVGHTGSGKSSIINVLMRFYEYQSGDVLIDGVSIRDYSYEELRSTMGLVLQDSYLFYGDVNRNIRLLDENITDKHIQTAAQFVHADRFIENHPEGYHRKVIEGGASYSSGEKQLISFARTMVRDPKILILDEATANIDTETEAYIQSGLERMRRGRTTIAIAHRLSTIMNADKIIVLDKGQIIEEGSHDELIKKKGTYYQMYRLQTMDE